jgi:type I restriction enzyme R subunit
VDAYHHFADPEWDGEPASETTEDQPTVKYETTNKDFGGSILREKPTEKYKKLKIKLRDGKEREIQHMISTSFWSADGKPVSVQEFMDNMFGTMPEFFKSEEELRKIWSNPTTRKVFLEKIAEAGYGKDELETLQKLIDAEQSDLFDVLAYVSFASKPISRTERVDTTKKIILKGLDEKQTEFLQFVLNKYIDNGVEELDEEKLPQLLNLKYYAIANAEQELGDVFKIRNLFIDFQKGLYSNKIKNNITIQKN